MRYTELIWRGTVHVCVMCALKPGCKSCGSLHLFHFICKGCQQMDGVHTCLSQGFLRCMAWNSKANCLFTHTIQTTYLTVLPPSSRPTVNPIMFSLKNKKDAALQATDVKTAHYWLCSHEVRWSGQHVFTAIIEYKKAFDLIPPTWLQEIFYIF